jgi:hypothetical protein
MLLITHKIELAKWEREDFSFSNPNGILRQMQGKPTREY